MLLQDLMAGDKECVVTEEMATVLRISRIFGIAPVHIKTAHISVLNSTGTINYYKVSASKTYRTISSIFIVLICKL